MAGDSLADLLGGRRGAIEASLPPLAFGIGWIATGHSVLGGVVTALVVGAVVAGWRLRQGDRPRAVLISLLGVCLAALIALRTGRAVDFFLLQLVTNAVSALAWLVSIAIRWPLLGVIVGLALGQKTRWRRDPALMRAYSWGSGVWVLQYVVRLAVFLPLYAADQVIALTAARAALTWPLVAACVAVSWWVIRRTLPPEHPGLRHPVEPTAAGTPTASGTPTATTLPAASGAPATGDQADDRADAADPPAADPGPTARHDLTR